MSTSLDSLIPIKHYLNSLNTKQMVADCLPLSV